MSAVHLPPRIVEDRVESAGMFASTAMTRLHRIVCLLPSIEVVVFCFLVLRVTLTEGHLPSYGNPDPKTIPFPVDYWCSLLLLPAAFASTVWVVLAMPFRQLFEKHYHFWTWTFCNLAVFWAFVLTMRADVAGLSNWYMD